MKCEQYAIACTRGMQTDFGGQNSKDPKNFIQRSKKPF